MIADTIDWIDNCPEGGERDLMIRILTETFEPVLERDPDWPSRMVSGLSDDQIREYLDGLRDKLARALFGDIDVASDTE